MKNFYKNIAKPILDKLLACTLFLLLLPLFCTTALLVFLFIGKPIFFTQKRPGKDEKIFTIYKFRTMTNARDRHGDLLPDAARLQGVGKLIRSLSLDELPQLLNVIKGEMSFIGPRPLLIEYLDLYSSEQKRRHEVAPGITGLAQIKGRNTLSWEERFAYDIQYVNNVSFFLDLKILALTLIKVLKRDGISSKTNVTMEKFKG